MNDSLTVLIKREQIDGRIEELAKQINESYGDKSFKAICVLRGAFVFCADLLRKVQSPCELDFISLSSYGLDDKSSGEVRIVEDLRMSCQGQDVVIIEDIIDSGETMKFLIPYLKKQGARTVEVAALLSKPSRRTHPLTIDYLGFEIEDRFVVGVGLDYAGKYRHLPDLCEVEVAGDH